MDQNQLDQFIEELNQKPDFTLEESKCYKYGLWLLCRRDYSEHKLRKKMREKEYTKDEINPAIKLLLEQNYLREDAYIEARIKGFMNKNQSPSHIKRKLAEEKLDVEIDTIQAIFDEYKMSTSDQLDALVRKKMPLEWPEDRQQSFKAESKILRFLVTKGHSFGESKEAIQRAKQNLLDSYE